MSKKRSQATDVKKLCNPLIVLNISVIAKNLFTVFFPDTCNWVKPIFRAIEAHVKDTFKSFLPVSPFNFQPWQTTSTAGDIKCIFSLSLLFLNGLDISYCYIWIMFTVFSPGRVDALLTVVRPSQKSGRAAFPHPALHETQFCIHYQVYMLT